MAWPSRRVLVVITLVLLVGLGLAAYFFRGSGRGTVYDAALEAIARRDLRGAGELLDQYLAAHPRDAEARFLAARTARRRGAFEEFQRHIAIHKAEKGSDRDRAFEYRLFRIQQGDLSEGELNLRSASTSPGELESSLMLEALIEGSLFALQSRSGQSSRPPAGATDRYVILARRAVDLWLSSHPTGPDQVQGLVWRGRVRAAAGDFDGSVGDFRAALQRDPAHFDARFQLAITIGSVNHVEAVQLLEQLQQSQPDNVSVQIGLANSYRLLGRPLEARTILRGLTDRGMNDPWLLNELGLTELDSGNPAEAEKLLRQTLERHPDDLVANLAMSRCMMLAGRVEEASRYQERYEAARAKSNVARGPPNQP